MKEQNQKLIDQIIDVSHKLIFFEKKKIFKINQLNLYPSEVNLILLINQYQATNSTKMAEKLSVTKGAISQTISRLIKKDILTKSKDRYNKNELTLSFTPFGQIALKKYLKLKTSVREQYDMYLSSLNKDQKNTIKNFLSHMEKMLDEIK